MRNVVRYSKAISIRLGVSLLLILATALSACAADEAEQTETVVTEEAGIEADQQVEEEAPDQLAVDEMLEATPPATEAAEAGGEMNKTMAEIAALRATRLMDYPVVNPQGESLGEIEEILLDLDGEQVLYAIMETEGFLEFGEKLYPVPLDQLELDPLTEAMILDITEAELETAPGFEAAEWPNVTDPQWRTYWGNRTDAAGLDETIVRATELLNYDVENPQDEDLGDIEDIVVNKEDGTVKYALLSFEEGVFNNDEKFFPIPLRIMAMDHANGNIILDIDQETLEKAPGFDPADWPETANALWEEDMLDFWENR